MTSVADATASLATPSASTGSTSGPSAAADDRATISVRNLWKVFGPAEARLARGGTAIPSADSIERPSTSTAARSPSRTCRST